MFVIKQLMVTIDFHSIFPILWKSTDTVNSLDTKISLREIRNSYRFGTTQGWVNQDRIFILRWSIPLKLATTPHLRGIMGESRIKCKHLWRNLVGAAAFLRLILLRINRWIHDGHLFLTRINLQEGAGLCLAGGRWRTYAYHHFNLHRNTTTSAQ